MIDLIPLFSLSVSKICLDGEYQIPVEDESGVLELTKVSLKDSEIKKVEDDFYIIVNASGKMKIKDSITLDDVWYPFEVKIDEKLDEFIENDKNILDINQFLWQNIVLEVPLRYTVVSDYSKIQGDGWKLVSEEELVSNNPFSTLLSEEDRSD